MASRIFQKLADSAINVDMIVQNISHGSDTPATDLSFTIDKPDVAKAQGVIDGMRADIGFGETLADEKIGKLSIVGVGMRSHSGVAAKMFDVLANTGVNIQMISTSEIKSPWSSISTRRRKPPRRSTTRFLVDQPALVAARAGW